MLFHLAVVIIILSTNLGNKIDGVLALSELHIVSYLAKILNVYNTLGIKLVIINGLIVVSIDEINTLLEYILILYKLIVISLI